MTKETKKIYCRDCGAEMMCSPVRVKWEKGFDQNTGEPLRESEWFRYICPNKRWYHFDFKHDDRVMLGDGGLEIKL